MLEDLVVHRKKNQKKHRLEPREPPLLQADAELQGDAVADLDPRLRYLQCGRGDELQVLTPEGVRRGGLFDERFCNIGGTCSANGRTASSSTPSTAALLVESSLPEAWSLSDKEKN